MHDVIRFWMDRGVDGLRLDAIHKIAKDPLLRDHVGAPRRHDEDWDTIHERLRGIRRVVDEYDDRMIVGEVALQDLHRVVGYLASGDQLHLAHNFVFVDLPWDATRSAPRSTTSRRSPTAPRGRPGSSPTTTSRAWPRASAGPTGARAAALILYALRGTPFIYQGEELGLPDAEIPPDRVVDVDGRDPERAPIPWDGRRSGARLQRRRAVAAVRGRGGGAERRGPGRRPAVDAVAGAPAGRAPARRAGAAERHRSARSTRARTCSRGCAATSSWRRSTSASRRRRLALDGTLVLSTDPDRADGPVDVLAPAEGVILRERQPRLGRGAACRPGCVHFNVV